jgi:hypothetical protein
MFPEYNTQLFTDIYSDVNDFLSDYNGLGIPALLQTANVTTLYYLLYGKYGNSPIANLDVNQFKYKLFSLIWQYGPTWEKRLDIQNTLRNFTESDLKAGAIRLLKGEGDITTKNTGTQTNVKTGNVADAHTGTIGDSGSDTYNNYAQAKTGQDIHNHAFNPETAPGTGTSTELSYINEQTVDKYNNTNTTTGSVSHSNTKTLGNSDTTTFNNVQDQRTDNLTNVQDRDTTDTETLTIGKLDAYQQLWDMLDNDVTAEFLSRFSICFKQFVRPARVYIYESED